MMLVPDELHREVWEGDVRDGIAEGNLLLFGHGFSVLYGEVEPPAGVDVALVAPKGPGHLVRRQYIEGSGVPGLVAIHQDATGNAKALALAYAKGIGCTRGGVFETTFKEETETDLFGEQAVLCGGASRARPGRLRDARRGRLRPADGLLRVPARAQADRRPDVREGPGRHALLDLQHGRVRRLHARPARHQRRDARRDEEDPHRDPGRRLRPRVDRREPRRPGELQAHARRAGRQPGRDDRQGAALADGLDRRLGASPHGRASADAARPPFATVLGAVATGVSRWSHHRGATTQLPPHAWAPLRTSTRGAP